MPKSIRDNTFDIIEGLTVIGLIMLVVLHPDLLLKIVGMVSTTMSNVIGLAH